MSRPHRAVPRSRRHPAVAPALLVAILTLCITGCYEPDDHSPTAPAVRNALVLFVSADSIPADGVSSLVVTAKIDPAATTANRTLVFTTNDGSFVEATGADAKTLERVVDAQGEASATLRSSRNVRPVEITVTVKEVSTVVARTTVSFTEAPAAETLSFVESPASAPADGATRSPVTVAIAASLPSTSREVSFTTSLGTFAQSGNSSHAATAGSDHRARADLISPDAPGQARLTAEVDGVTVQTFVDFVAALPETILVFPAKSRLEATQEAAGSTQVAVTLLRSVGQVSSTVVQPRLVAADTRQVLPASFSALQPTRRETTFTLTVGPIAYRGLADLEVQVPGSSEVGTARIEIIDPL